MKVLIACEESQTVCKAFREREHEAYSCDILPASGGHPEWHFHMDVLRVLENDWDLLIAHPPCTYLSNVSAPHLFNKDGTIKNEERYEKGKIAKEFFMEFYNAKHIPKRCIENPTPLTIFKLPPYTQVVQPYEYGHPVQKRTCLWLFNLPKLVPTKIMEEREPTTVAGNWYNKAGKDRARIRSKTFEGIAKAMAEQWG